MSAEVIRLRMPGALRVVAREGRHDVVWIANPASMPQTIVSSAYDDVAAWVAEAMAAKHGFRVLPAVQS